MVYIDPCSCSSVPTTVKTKVCLVTMFASYSCNPSWASDIDCITYLYDCIGMVSFLGHVVMITGTGVQSQENMHEWLSNDMPCDSVMIVHWHIQICISQAKLT